MGEPSRFIADAYDKAAEAVESALETVLRAREQ
jgi:hypothetical protein